MFLSEPSETPFDLQFWLFGTHVRGQPVVLAYQRDPRLGHRRRIGERAWLLSGRLGGCVFVSVLVHEFGHVFMGQLFGSHGHIVLHGFGGLAIGSNALNRGWQRFLVSFAGPLIQFVLLGLVLLAMFALVPDSAPPPRVRLVPAGADYAGFPAGHQSLLAAPQPAADLAVGRRPNGPRGAGRRVPRNGVFLSFAISAVVAGLLAVHCLLVVWNRNYPLADDLPFDHLYLAIFFALFCAQSIMALSSMNSARSQRYRDDDFPWLAGGGDSAARH